MHKTPWRRKQENLFVETFFHAFSPDYHLALAHKFNKFSSFLDEEENGWSDKESSSSICLWNLLFFTRDEDGMKWIDVNLSLRALVEDFFCLLKSTLSATTNHRNSVLAFFPEENSSGRERWPWGESSDASKAFTKNYSSKRRLNIELSLTGVTKRMTYFIYFSSPGACIEWPNSWFIESANEAFVTNDYRSSQKLIRSDNFSSSVSNSHWGYKKISLNILLCWVHCLQLRTAKPKLIN